MSGPTPEERARMDALNAKRDPVAQELADAARDYLLNAGSKAVVRLGNALNAYDAKWGLPK